METKYADLIEQLEQVAEAYEAALAAAKTMAAVVNQYDDVLGVYGGVGYYGGDFEKNRAIHVTSGCFAQAAIDCGSGFKMEEQGGGYTRFDCSMFGYRVFALFRRDERGYAELKEKVEANTLTGGRYDEN